MGIDLVNGMRKIELKSEVGDLVVDCYVGVMFLLILVAGAPLIKEYTSLFEM